MFSKKGVISKEIIIIKKGHSKELPICTYLIEISVMTNKSSLDVVGTTFL
jgi:hypothetical protein